MDDNLPNYDRWKLASPYDNDPETVEFKECDCCEGAGWLNTDDEREIMCPECCGSGSIEH